MLQFDFSSQSTLQFLSHRELKLSQDVTVCRLSDKGNSVNEILEKKMPRKFLWVDNPLCLRPWPVVTECAVLVHLEFS